MQGDRPGELTSPRGASHQGTHRPRGHTRGARPWAVISVTSPGRRWSRSRWGHAAGLVPAPGWRRLWGDVGRGAQASAPRPSAQRPKVWRVRAVRPQRPLSPQGTAVERGDEGVQPGPRLPGRELPVPGAVHGKRVPLRPPAPGRRVQGAWAASLGALGRLLGSWCGRGPRGGWEVDSRRGEGSGLGPRSRGDVGVGAAGSQTRGCTVPGSALQTCLPARLAPVLGQSLQAPSPSLRGGFPSREEPATGEQAEPSTERGETVDVWAGGLREGRQPWAVPLWGAAPVLSSRWSVWRTNGPSALCPARPWRCRVSRGLCSLRPRCPRLTLSHRRACRCGQLGLCSAAWSAGRGRGSCSSARPHLGSWSCGRRVPGLGTHTLCRWPGAAPPRASCGSETPVSFRASNPECLSQSGSVCPVPRVSLCTATSPPSAPSAASRAPGPPAHAGRRRPSRRPAQVPPTHRSRGARPPSSGHSPSLSPLPFLLLSWLLPRCSPLNKPFSP